MDERTMIVRATGSAVLDAGDSRLQGESLEVNLKTELGAVTGGEGFAQEYYFSGDRIERIDAERFRVTNGSFTACEGASPAWSFHSPDTLVHLDNYIYSWHPNLRVKGVPVFYIPYAIVPIKPSRATGLLIPRVNYGSKDGFVYGQDLFWALTDSADVTIGFDYYQERGVRYGLEGNYVIDQGSKGMLTTSYIRDRTVAEEQERWNVSFDHQHDLPWGIRGLVDVDYQSDNNYQRDYAVDLADVAEERLNSALSLTRSFGAVTATLSAEWQRSLTWEEDGTDKDSSLTRAPSLSVSRPDGRIGDTPVHYSFKFQGIGLKSVKEEVTQETDRYDGSGRVSLPVDVQAWATVTPSMGLQVHLLHQGPRGGDSRPLPVQPEVRPGGAAALSHLRRRRGQGRDSSTCSTRGSPTAICPTSTRHPSRASTAPTGSGRRTPSPTGWSTRSWGSSPTPTGRARCATSCGWTSPSGTTSTPPPAPTASPVRWVMSRRTWTPARSTG